MTQENSQSEEEQPTDEPKDYGDTDVRGAESRDERDNAVDNKLDQISDKLDSIDESIANIEIRVASNSEELDTKEVAEGIVGDEEVAEEIAEEVEGDEDEDDEDDEDDSAGDDPAAATNTYVPMGTPALPEPTTEGWYGAPTPGDLVLITQGQTRKQLRNYSKKGVVMSVDMGESPDDTFYEVLFRSGSLSRYKEKNMVVFERRDSTPDTDTDRSIRAYFKESFGGVS